MESSTTNGLQVGYIETNNDVDLMVSVQIQLELLTSQVEKLREEVEKLRKDEIE